MAQEKNAIINGKLKDNEALPSVRTLSGKLKISALTVKKAYDYLEEDELSQAINKAKSIGLTCEEIMEMIAIIIED